MDNTKVNDIRANIPNFITSLRIVGTLFLMFQEPLTLRFFIIYAFTGLTDALDGWLARKLGVASTFGARLDSIADLLFYSTMIIKVFQYLLRELPVSLWIWIWSVVFMRIVIYVYVGIRHRRFSSIHTYMNKMTGGMMFMLPCVLMTSYTVIYSWITCAIAFLATVEEMIIHIIKKEYVTDVKSLLIDKM